MSTYLVDNKELWATCRIKQTNKRSISRSDRESQCCCCGCTRRVTSLVWEEEGKKERKKERKIRKKDQIRKKERKEGRMVSQKEQSQMSPFALPMPKRMVITLLCAFATFFSYLMRVVISMEILHMGDEFGLGRATTWHRALIVLLRLHRLSAARRMVVRQVRRQASAGLRRLVVLHRVHLHRVSRRLGNRRFGRRSKRWRTRSGSHLPFHLVSPRPMASGESSVETDTTTTTNRSLLIHTHNEKTDTREVETQLDCTRWNVRWCRRRL